MSLQKDNLNINLITNYEDMAEKKWPVFYTKSSVTVIFDKLFSSFTLRLCDFTLCLCGKLGNKYGREEVACILH